MSSIPSLSPSYVFGLNSNVQSNAFFLDESTVIYPVGHQLVHYNIEKKNQKIINLLTDGDLISCMAVYLPENLLAIGTKSQSEANSATIMIFEINTGKRRKVYKTGDSCKELISVSFSSDGKFVFGQGCAPDWLMYAWTVEKGKLVTSIKSTSGHLEIKKLSANLFDRNATHICVTGVNLFRLFRFQEGFVKLMHQMKIDNEIKTHTWISEARIACGTIDSKIMIFDNGELISEFQYLPTLNAKNLLIGEGPLQPAISAMASFSNGIFIGLENGTLLYYEKIDEDPYYRKKKEVAFENSPVTCITWNAKDDRAVVTVKSNQIYLFQIETDQKGESVKHDRLSFSFHTGPILGIDACLTKPLVASSGADGSIRLWNYTENSLEVVNQFEEAASCIAIHPNGLYLLAGFPSAVRLMAILLDDIKPFWETPTKSARGCKFSHGGQYFAIISAINVTIFNTYSFEIVSIIKNGTGRIHSILWSEDDTRLITLCSDGLVQQYSAFGFSKISETKLDSMVTSCVFNMSGNTSYTLSADGTTREIVKGELGRDLNAKTPLKQLLLSNLSNVMIQSTAAGSIRAVKYPYNPEGPIQDEAVEYSFSEVPLQSILFSANSRYLFCAGEDGALWIYKMQDKDGRRKDWEYSDEILVQKSDLRDNYKYINELRQQVDEMKLQGEASMTSKDILHNSREQDMYAHHEKEISAIQLAIEKTRGETAELIAKNNEELEQLKKENEKEVSDIKEAFVKKMEMEHEKYVTLLEKRNVLEQQWQARIRNIQETHEHDVTELNKFFAAHMEEKNELANQLREDRVISKEQHEKQISEIEKDIEQEALEIMCYFESKLKEEKSLFSSVLEDNNSMKATFESLQTQIEDRKVELNACAIQNRKLASLIKALENDVVGLKGEIRERDETIFDKEKRILDLKKKNQELEKFKFVLDFKIVELKKQEEPREKDMVFLDQTLKLMKDEVKEVSIGKKKLDRQYEIMIMKNYGIQLNRNSEKWKKNQLKNAFSTIKEDLHQVMSSISSKNALVKACIALYHKYRDLEETPDVAPPGSLPKYSESELIQALNHPGDEDVKLEVHATKGSEDTRGRKQLEKTIQILKKEGKKLELRRKIEAMKMLEEGSVLTKELNAIRKEIHEKKCRISRMEDAFHKGTRMSQFLRDEIKSKKELSLKTPEVSKEEMNSTIMPLPPILPPKDIL